MQDADVSGRRNEKFIKESETCSESRRMQDADVSCGRNENNIKFMVGDEVATNGPQGGTVREGKNVKNLWKERVEYKNVRSLSAILLAYVEAIMDRSGFFGQIKWEDNVSMLRLRWAPL